MTAARSARTPRAIGLAALLSATAAAYTGCEVRQGPEASAGVAAQAQSAPATGEYSVFRRPALTVAPTPRWQAAISFDSTRGRAVLFGGIHSDVTTGLVADTWEYGDDTWVKRCDPGSCTSPSVRSSAALAFAPQRGVSVLFGGAQGGNFWCDTWEWDGQSASWQPRSEPVCTDTGITAGRAGHSMAGFDDEVALFGGMVLHASTFTRTRSNELWWWNGTTWSALCDADCAAHGPLPAGRIFAPLVFAERGGKKSLFVFGGTADSGTLADLWEFDLGTRRWTERCTSAACRSSAPRARGQHVAVFQNRRDRLFIHGGCADPAADCATVLDDAHEYDPAQDRWTPIPVPVYPALPGARHTVAAVYDSGRHRVVEFGGFSRAVSPAQFLNETVEFYTRGGACGSDADCASGVCVRKLPSDASGACAERCAPGDGNDGSGPCVDGFRCNAACDQPCETCAGPAGSCTLLDGGTDDHCSGAKACSASGACLAANGQSCSIPGACASGNCAVFGEPVCTSRDCGTQPCMKARADGTCAPSPRGESFDCDGHLTCGDGGSCLTRCERDADCAPDYFCEDASGACVIGKRYGETCERSEECGRGTCSFGACCDDICDDPCQKCGADGHCETLAAGEPPRVACGSGDCAGYCSGTSSDCTFPGATTRCDVPDCPEGNCKTSCESGQLNEWTCDGTGACVARTPHDCWPYNCDVDACRKTCDRDEHCRKASICDRSSGGCTPQGVRCSDDGFQVVLQNGNVVDCDGYACKAGGMCAEICADDSECDAPNYRCEAPRCVRVDGGTDAGATPPDGGNALRGDAAATQPNPGANPAPPDEGCTMAPARGKAPPALWMLVGLGWLVRRRRWR